VLQLSPIIICDKGVAFAEHGISRYHAITALDQKQEQKGQGWMSGKFFKESVAGTSEQPDMRV